MTDEFLSALGLCRKAGFVKFGFDTVKASVISGEAYAVYTAFDISEKTLKEISYICNRCGVKLVKTAYDMRTLGGAIGKTTGIIAVADYGFAEMLNRKFSKNEEDEL